MTKEQGYAAAWLGAFVAAVVTQGGGDNAICLVPPLLLAAASIYACVVAPARLAILTIFVAPLVVAAGAEMNLLLLRAAFDAQHRHPFSSFGDIAAIYFFLMVMVAPVFTSLACLAVVLGRRGNPVR